jgi:hypothetical protein
VGEAARLLQLSERQVQRLKRRYRPDSIAWVHHGNRGQPMPWALPAAIAPIAIYQVLQDIAAGFSWLGMMHSATFRWGAQPMYAAGWLAAAAIVYSAHWWRGDALVAG